MKVYPVMVETGAFDYDCNLANIIGVYRSLESAEKSLRSYTDGKSHPFRNCELKQTEICLWEMDAGSFGPFATIYKMELDE